MKDASPFLNPVDAVALGIPHYYTVIKQPMDLSTVEKKLDNSNPSKPAKSDQPRYYHIDEFAKEVRLIFQNCVTFNGAEHPISQMGKRVEAVFTKQLKQMPPAEEMPKPAAVPVAKPTLPVAPPPLPVKKVEKAEKPPAPARRTSMSVPTIRRSDTEVPGRPKREIHPPAPKDLPYADPPKKPRRTKDRKDDGTADQLRFCGKILSDLQKKQYWNCASPFYDPVDWVALNIPSYPKIIKKPMDFSTMKKKLEKGEYSNASKFHADFKLMLRNCFTFNPAGSSVNEAGQELQRVFDEKWAALPPLRERSESEGEDEEDEEEDDDDEKSRIVSMMKTQIEVLQRNLSAIDSKKVKKKEKKEKRDKYASSSAGPSKSSSSKAQPTGKSSSSSKKGKKVADDDVLSFEQKKDLSETIATLDGPKLEKVIQIIHEGVPEIRDSTEEIELDIDQLPSSVLTKLYNYVLRPLRPAPKRSRGTGGGTGGLKRKSMDEDAEAERIRKLEQRIALFDDKNGSAPGASARRDDDSVHSSEESSDDSSGSDSD
ncbi:Bromodomain-containing protein [Sistotremastrum suecicum HHB10207 ss-3]|uniref:Bromodomain-containing protein n=1 Tax=Sistotremastrum suecicum HHB10207 ss-3 TaxID=1314776 RepID=A0A166BPY1_9AGAM|nr:Bromodomain-containing protein [Sistotremastrum suecicum HHB10207 ss-3]